MELSKYTKIEKLSDSQLKIDKQFSLIYPLINSEDGSSWQLCLKIYAKDNIVIIHEELSDFDKYLKDYQMCCVKLVEIHTKQTSKLGKKYKEKLPIKVESGKNIGKKNQTSILEQAIYKADIQHTKMKTKKQQTGQTAPYAMLLQTYAYDKNEENKEDRKQLIFPQFVQKKYDGLRCIITFKDGQVQLFSRGQRELTNLQHINQQTLNLLNRFYMEYTYMKDKTIYIDGELYIEGHNLQQLNSIIRSQSTDSSYIKFHLFDVDLQQNRDQIKLEFKDRLGVMKDLQIIVEKLELSNIVVVETVTVSNEQVLDKLLAQYISEGYEGIVIRDPKSLYVYSINGKRSKDTLKYKQRLDTEVQVVGFGEGQGKDSQSIIWKCTYNGNQFNVVQNQTIERRKQQFTTLINNPKYFEILNRIPLQIEYSGMSESQVPQQPRGVAFRLDQTQFTFEDIPHDMRELGFF